MRFDTEADAGLPLFANLLNCPAGYPAVTNIPDTDAV
jgi:hypothetical protein